MCGVVRGVCGVRVLIQRKEKHGMLCIILFGAFGWLLVQTAVLLTCARGLHKWLQKYDGGVQLCAWQRMTKVLIISILTSSPP